MNSTTSNAMPDTAPETPIVEPRPVQQETAENEHLVHPGAKLGWSESAGMYAQQSSALEWVEASSEARIAERAAMQEGSAAVEMTDSRQAAQYSRWSGEPLGETAGETQSAGIGQSH